MSKTTEYLIETETERDKKPFLTREDIEGDKWNKAFSKNMETLADKRAFREFNKNI